MKQTFISYSREDTSFVTRLYEDLQANGISQWIDREDILAGIPWDETVQQALKQCDIVLVILSPASVRTTHVLDEMSYALDNGKRIIPLLYRSCEVPLCLSRIQYIDFTNDYAAGLTQLLESLNAQKNPDATVSAKKPVSVPVQKGDDVRRGPKWLTPALIIASIGGILVPILLFIVPKLILPRPCAAPDPQLVHELTLEAPKLSFHLGQLSTLPIRYVLTKQGAQPLRIFDNKDAHLTELQFSKNSSSSARLLLEATADDSTQTLRLDPKGGKLLARFKASDGTETPVKGYVEIRFKKIDADTFIELLPDGIQVDRVEQDPSICWENAKLKTLRLQNGKLQIQRY